MLKKMILTLICATVVGQMALASTATEPEIITLEMQWEAGAEGDDDVIFGVISGLDVDAAGNVYVADRQLNLVSKFSPDGEHLGPLGREGDGPGEYRRVGDLFVTGPEEVGVMQRMPGKINTLTADGLPGRSIAIPSGLTETPAYFFNGRVVGDQVLILSNQMQRDGESMSIIRSLVRVSAEGEEIARLSEVLEETNLTDFQVEEKTHSPVIWAAAPNGNVFLSDEFDAYSIREYDAAGKLVNSISRQYEHRSRNSQEMDENTPRMAVRSQSGERQDAEGTPSKTDRDLQALYVRPDGALWVLTSRGAYDCADGVLATFDVFSDGRTFSHQVSLHGEGNFHDDGLRLIGNRVYLMRGLRAAALTGRGDGSESDNAIPMSVVCFEIS